MTSEQPAADDGFAPACTAPYVVMDFDPAGNVQACCVNAMYPLGNVATATLRDIWDGERARTLRRAIERHDLGYGCGVCRHRLTYAAGDPATWYYGRFPAPDPNPRYPYLMAFALHNTCNAACIMCGGDLSSKIRSQREHRPALPHVYGDRFFDELEEFLPHLGVAEFRGGEPFLITEHFRVFDALIRIGNRIPCNVTTNGTILNDRVEAVMAELPMSFMVSIDGTSRETLEAVRVGVSWDKLMANVPRLLDYTRGRGTTFELSCCALQQNWHEIPDIFRFAADLGVRLSVQPVLDRRFGLHRLPTEELRAVATELEARSAGLDAVLDEENLGTWHGFLGWLRQELEQRAEGEPRRIFEFPDPTNIGHVADVRGAVGGRAALAPSPPPAPVALSARPWWQRLARRRSTVAASAPLATTPREQDPPARSELAAWAPDGTVGALDTDPQGLVTSADLAPLRTAGYSVPTVTGATFEEALRSLAEVLGPNVWIAEEADRGELIDHTLFLGLSEHRDKRGMVLRLISQADGAGGVRSWFALDPVLEDASWRDQPAADDPVMETATPGSPRNDGSMAR